MSAATTPSGPPEASPPSAENVSVIKFSAVGECWIPLHIPPGVIERLKEGRWMFTTDCELVREVIEVARCLGKKAKVVLI